MYVELSEGRLAPRVHAHPLLPRTTSRGLAWPRAAHRCFNQGLAEFFKRCVSRWSRLKQDFPLSVAALKELTASDTQSLNMNFEIPFICHQN